MKKLFLFLVAAFVVNIVVAQDGKGNRLSGMVIAQLDLTDAQKEKVKAINAEYRTDMQEVIKSDLTPEQRKDRRTALEGKKREKIVALLTPAQKQKLTALEGSGEYKQKGSVNGREVKVKVDD